MCKCTPDLSAWKWWCKWMLESVLNRCCRPAVFLRRQLMDLIKHTGGRLMTLHTTRDAANGSDVLKWVRGMRGTEQPVRLPWPSAFSQLRVSPHPTQPRPPPRSSPGNESSSPWAQPASAASARPPALYSAGSPPAPAHAKNQHNKDELLSGTSFLCSHQVCFGHRSSAFIWCLPARCEKKNRDLFFLEIRFHKQCRSFKRTKYSIQRHIRVWDPKRRVSRTHQGHFLPKSKERRRNDFMPPHIFISVMQKKYLSIFYLLLFKVYRYISYAYICFVHWICFSWTYLNMCFT